MIVTNNDTSLLTVARLQITMDHMHWSLAVEIVHAQADLLGPLQNLIKICRQPLE